MIGLQIKNKKQLVILIALIVLGVAFFGGLYILKPAAASIPPDAPGEEVDVTASEEEPPDERITLITDMLAQIERQEQVDAMLLAELGSGDYTFSEPLVVADPYGMSPLSAIVLFTSDEPLRISVHVPGKTSLTDVDFTFERFNTTHLIPIYGLYPDELNAVELTATTQTGITSETTFEIKTEPLPTQLAQYIIITDLVRPSSYQPGFNFTYVRKSAFDAEGDFRWFYSDFMTQQTVLYEYNGNFVMTKGKFHEGDALIFEVNPLGKVLSVYYSPYGVHHDVVAIDGKNLLVSGSYGETVEDFIYEIDMDTGIITNTLDLKEILQRNRITAHQYYSTSDWFHHNATVYSDGHIVISGRHQSTVARISWPDGKLDWILSDHEGWNPMFQKHLLNPVGGEFEWSYAQHAPEILPDYDNNPDTIDILLFDNGSIISEQDRINTGTEIDGDDTSAELYSRMVHYRINQRTRTVEQVFQWGKELGDIYYCTQRGSAYLLDNGNFLGTFDRVVSDHGGDFNTNFVEVDSSGNIVWEAYATGRDKVGKFPAYRSVRLPLYTAAANDLQIGVPARVFIPEGLR